MKQELTIVVIWQESGQIAQIPAVKLQFDSVFMISYFPYLRRAFIGRI